ELVRAVAFDGADLPVSAVLRPGLVLGVGQAVVVGEMPRGVADVLVPGGDRRRVADRVDLGDLLDEVLVVPVVFGAAAVVIGEGGDHRHAPHVVVLRAGGHDVVLGVAFGVGVFDSGDAAGAVADRGDPPPVHRRLG